MLKSQGLLPLGMVVEHAAEWDLDCCYVLTCMWKSVVLYDKLQVLALMLKGYDEQLASGVSCKV